MFAVCALLKNWAGLYDEEDREAIKNGAGTLAKKALEVASQSATMAAAGQASQFLMITNG